MKLNSICFNVIKNDQQYIKLVIEQNSGLVSTYTFLLETFSSVPLYCINKY